MSGAGPLMSTLKLKKQADGIVLDYGHVRLALDTGIKGETTLLTHGHTDHLRGVEKAHRVVATKATIDTLRARGYGFKGRVELLEYNQRIGQLGVVVTALNAGHVLGSSMYLMEFDEGLSVLYTGDFNVVDSMVHRAASPVTADVLITEATYGTPEWVFPSRKSIYNDILTAAAEVLEKEQIPVFSAYSLGKAQEAIALLQWGGFNVVSGNHRIDEVCKVYNQHGSDLRHTSLKQREAEELLSEGCAIVTSSFHHTRNNIQNTLGNKAANRIINNIEHYSLSGWTLGDSSKTGFPLSAHSDFKGLKKFAKNVNPRVVYCFTGNASHFSGHLVDDGLNAVPLE
ncbi:MAG: MBL fold metallo-hydrolase [Candidatus Thorarchaeota archaeon]|jgi:putative mRNA 3-end processing factor